jgi:hypothetical protein
MYITGSENALNEQVTLYPLQEYIAPYVGDIAVVWWCIFAAVSLTLLSFVVRAWFRKTDV